MCSTITSVDRAFARWQIARSVLQLEELQAEFPQEKRARPTSRYVQSEATRMATNYERRIHFIFRCTRSSSLYHSRVCAVVKFYAAQYWTRLARSEVIPRDPSTPRSSVVTENLLEAVSAFHGRYRTVPDKDGNEYIRFVHRKFMDILDKDVRLIQAMMKRRGNSDERTYACNTIANAVWDLHNELGSFCPNQLL